MDTGIEEKKLEVAKLGRPVGLSGEQRLIILSDFPEQLEDLETIWVGQGRQFEEMAVEYVDTEQGVIKFSQLNSREEAKRYTNRTLYVSEEATREQCDLQEGEYFWFEVVGCEIVENDSVLGTIKEIQRIGAVDYFLVQTDSQWVDKGMVKSFLIPYVDRYVANVDLEAKKVLSTDALDILEAS